MIKQDKTQINNDCLSSTFWVILNQCSKECKVLLQHHQNHIKKIVFQSIRQELTSLRFILLRCLVYCIVMCSSNNMFKLSSLYLQSCKRSSKRVYIRVLISDVYFHYESACLPARDFVFVCFCTSLFPGLH